MERIRTSWTQVRRAIHSTGGLSKAAPIRVRRVPGVTLILLGGSKLWNSWRRCHFRCALIVRNGARYRPQFTWILSVVCGRLHCRAQWALERIIAWELLLRDCCYKMKDQKENLTFLVASFFKIVVASFCKIAPPPINHCTWKVSVLRTHHPATNMHAVEHFFGEVSDLTLVLLTWRIWWVPNNASRWQMGFNSAFSPLNAELNPICHLLALIGAHHILHVSRIRFKGLIPTSHLVVTFVTTDNCSS